MKKIIILITSLLFITSCGVTSYTTYADITWMNEAGHIHNKWNDALIQKTIDGTPINTPLKNGGWISFYTKDGESIMLSGGMIMISNIKETKDILIIRDTTSTQANANDNVWPDNPYR